VSAAGVVVLPDDLSCIVEAECPDWAAFPRGADLFRTAAADWLRSNASAGKGNPRTGY